MLDDHCLYGHFVTDASVKMKAEVARRISLDDLSAAFQGNVYSIWRMMHLFN